MSKLSKLNSGNEEDMHFSKLAHKAERVAMEEYDTELFTKLKDEKKKEIQQKFLRK